MTAIYPCYYCRTTCPHCFKPLLMEFETDTKELSLYTPSEAEKSDKTYEVLQLHAKIRNLQDEIELLEDARREE